MTRAFISIIGVVDEFDLRKVLSQRFYLRQVEMDFKLRNFEAVLFTNKSLTRFRMVLKLRGHLFVCSPEIDKTEQHSLYLKISEELAKMAQIDCKVKLDKLQGQVRDKLERIAKRSKKV